MKPSVGHHRKVNRLMGLLKINRAEAVGTLYLLWDSVARDKPSGILEGWDAEAVAGCAEWGGDADALLAALRTARLLDCGPCGTLTIHDWPEEAPRYIAQKWARTFKIKDEAEARSKMRATHDSLLRQAPLIDHDRPPIDHDPPVVTSALHSSALNGRGTPLPPEPPSPTEPAEASEPVGAGSVASDPGSGGSARPRPRNRHLPSGLADPRADVLGALKIERRKVTPLLSDDDEWQILQVVDQATRLGVSVLTQLTESLRAFHASRDPWLVERSHPLPSWRRDWNKYLPTAEPAPEAQCPECGDPARDGRCLVVGCPCACRKVAAS